MENCLFCKIINGEVPSYKIYEDDDTYAFLDISKDVDGHTLVLSKHHCKNILDADDKILSSVMKTVKKISNHYINNCGYDGVNIISYANEAAEQVIMHIHIHIIPRKKEDGLILSPSLNASKLTLEEAFKKFKLD